MELGNKIEVKLGNETDFKSFLTQFKKWDQQTLKIKFRLARMKKSLLVVRRVAPKMAQVHILPVSALPKIKSQLYKKDHVAQVFINIPKGVYYVFGAMITDVQNESGKSEEPLPKTIEQGPRRVGRPRKTNDLLVPKVL